MGVDLGAIVPREKTTVQAFAGRTVAFDAWNILYQFLSSIRQPDGTPLKAADGSVTSHLAGVLYRTGNLLEAGIRPVWVFDGEPHPLKQETLAARSARKEQASVDYEAAVAAGDMEKAASKAKQTSRLTWEMADQAKQLLRTLGVPVVEAPQEGEGQAAWMCMEGHVDAVCSQDFDCLLFGTPVMARNLTVTGRRKLPGKQVWVEVTPERIRLDAALKDLDLSREQLIDAALLIGTDFNPGVKGIGPKKAVQVIKKEGSLEALIQRLAADPDKADSALEKAMLEQHEALMDRDTIQSLFLDPVHTDDFTTTMGKADADAVHAFMVDTYGFSAERVDGALKKFDAARGAQAQTGLFDF